MDRGHCTESKKIEDFGEYPNPLKNRFILNPVVKNLLFLDGEPREAGLIPVAA
ncbi:hypothetical protein Oscil6304_1523 [Oscillatoria acuminata PCC 6304]|uniref:Uncharacterized protein n=1 Tax=Oscillatoria acuminata PCC 6304 TaxID=56110 RepID=K9TFP7_9CYAN|nr:hypothetical protein Oscil6304_1523 [Oscillatoria acuminata PCC 6304]